MARLSDHDVRDAEHALRAEIALLVGRYVRRIAENGKAIIQQELETAQREDRDFDGTTVGRAAAERAAFEYFGGLAGKPHEAIEGSTSGSETA